MLSARLRLASLWLSQVARIVGDWCLRLLVIVGVVGQDPAAITEAWHRVTAVCIFPFILLSPFNGAISNSLPKRWVLAGSAGYCLLVTVLFGIVSGPWLVGLGLLAVGSAIYYTTRFAMFPAASADSQVPLNRVNGWMDMGGSAAILVGLILGQLRGGVYVAIGCAAVAFVTAWPAYFPSDVSRPEPVLAAIKGFFRDCGRILRERETRGSLLGLAGFQAVLTAASGPVFLSAYERSDGEVLSGPLLWNLVFVSVGVALGALLASLQGHLRRALGLVPLGTAGLLIAFAWAASTDEQRWPCLVMGLMVGLVSVPLRAAYQAALPADARGNGMAVSNLLIYVCTALLALFVIGLVHVGILRTLTAQLGFLAVLAAVGVVAAGWSLRRELIEQLTELVLLPIYRIHGHGPGLHSFPERGPVLVVGNHAAWCDPLWVAKVVPRTMYPMMTSLFFDRPVLHWLMTRVVHAIRVPVSYYRRDAPELQEAVARLDQGDCVLLFPEGMLRRREAQIIRQFGQGVWHILRDRPQTPVVVCWIEGGWGSMVSFKDGPPLKNKRLDFWRRIDVAVCEPQLLDPALLEDQRATRAFLMRACLNARKYLGLEVPATPPSSEEEAEVSDEEGDKVTP